MGSSDRSVRGWLALLALCAASCVRRDEPVEARAPFADSAALSAIARDRPERLVLPLAPPGAGEVVYERVTPARAALDLPPPPAEPAEPPAPAFEPTEPGARTLKPPIPRGLPQIVRGGHGGHVTLDVRVDEHGDVSDVVLVETDADSLTTRAASEAARAMRYHPALLGGRRVPVWTRQVFGVTRDRARRP